jgi:hypothetical protein
VQGAGEKGSRGAEEKRGGGEEELRWRSDLGKFVPVNEWCFMPSREYAGVYRVS